MMNVLILHSYVSSVSTGYSYQWALFNYLQNYCNVTWLNDLQHLWQPKFSDTLKKVHQNIDVVVIGDEYALLNSIAINTEWDTNTPFVFITHDFWCHPARVAQFIDKLRNPLIVLRHFSAKRLYDHLLPHIRKVVLRPGVETAIFYPTTHEKQYDIILGGKDNEDYPFRSRLNRIVRLNAHKYRWNVLDMVGKNIGSAGSQQTFADLLSRSKVSPTATARGGVVPPTITVEYKDFSPERAKLSDSFFSLQNSDVFTIQFETAGITPRYLESLATKCLLFADLPQCDYQAWYANKMVVVDPQNDDDTIASTLDYWVKADSDRNRICDYAYKSVLATETSQHKAQELVNIINEYF